MNPFPRRGLAAAAVFGLAACAAPPAPAADKATLELYASHCEACHGEGGQAPDPDRNLADGEWLHGNSLAAAVKVITEGVPGKAMLSFKDQLTPQQITALARYVRSFAAPAAKASPPAKAKAPAAKGTP